MGSEVKLDYSFSVPDIDEVFSSLNETFKRTIGHAQATAQIAAAEVHRASKISEFISELVASANAVSEKLPSDLRVVFTEVDRVINHPDLVANRQLYLEHFEFFYTQSIREEFVKNRDSNGVADFLEGDLELKATPDTIEALWRLLRSNGWMEIPSRSLRKYLTVAIRREAKRLKRDREQRDRLWANGRLKFETHPDLSSRKDDRDFTLSVQAEEEVALLLRAQKLTAVQREILLQLKNGASPAEAVRAAGASWATWQSLQRKLRKAAQRFPAG